MNRNLSRRDFLKLAWHNIRRHSAFGLCIKATESPTPIATSDPPTETPGLTTKPLNPGEFWRLYADDSPGIPPIGFDPEIDPDSDAMIDTLRDSVSEGHIGINHAAWTIRCIMRCNTPTYAVRCLKNWGWAVDWFY